MIAQKQCALHEDVILRDRSDIQATTLRVHRAATGQSRGRYRQTLLPCLMCAIPSPVFLAIMPQEEGSQNLHKNWGTQNKPLRHKALVFLLFLYNQYTILCCVLSAVVRSSPVCRQ